MTDVEESKMRTRGIEYRLNHPLDPREVADVFVASGLSRPTDDLPRMTQMLAGANLVVSAWDTGRLVGICRSLTDHSWCCYVSELAVVAGYQKQGVGRSMIERLRQSVGDGVSIILLSVADAMPYYPKLGFELAGNAYVLTRRR